MPTYIPKNDLVSDLTGRVRGALEGADVNDDGVVDGRERRSLPSDVRSLADRTADHYLGGGPLPVGPYVSAYRNFVTRVTDAADRGDGRVLDTDLPSAVYGSVVALRAADDAPRARESLDRMYRRLGRSGWSDDDLRTFIDAAVGQGKLQVYGAKVLDAIKNPQMPAEDHSGAKFYETLAWYTDMTGGGRRDGRLTLSELEGAIDKAAQKYASIILQGGDTNARMQTWKNIQKLRLLEGEIGRRVEEGQGAFYPYAPRAMMQIDADSPWNRANTIDSSAEFQARVIQGSYDKPVLVKYGLPYCMHCLLLENLGSVPALDAKYGGDLDVVKLLSRGIIDLADGEVK